MITIEEDLPPCSATMTEGGEMRTRVNQNLAQFTAHARQRAALRSVELGSTILPGHAVKTVVEFAKQNEFDLVVVGFTGRSGIFNHLWGGDSQNLARLAPCSVLVVK
jgi:nucleotide-binding universal stress UspA family protein